MPVTNKDSGTSVDEIAERIYRISTPASANVIPGGFTFNQYLIDDDEPLLFHTGMRRMFPLVRDAVATIIPLDRLRYVSFSHVEADESGALNEWLAAAPNSMPLCGKLATQIQMHDLADRPPQSFGEGETIQLGAHSLQWYDAPHVPHGWDCGFIFETRTSTLFSSDLFTQPGDSHPALTEGDILGPSEALRQRLEYYSHAPNTRDVLQRLASLKPQTLACMHGSAWRGDGARLIEALSAELTR